MMFATVKDGRVVYDGFQRTGLSAVEAGCGMQHQFPGVSMQYFDVYLTAVPGFRP